MKARERWLGLLVALPAITVIIYTIVHNLWVV